MSRSTEDVVFEFLKGCESKDYAATRQAYQDYLADDMKWVQCGLPTTNSRDEAIGLLDAFNQAVGFTGWNTETITWAAQGDSLLIERVDHLLDSNGEIFMSVPIVGVFTVQNGKIVEWHEYFNPAPILERFQFGGAQS